MLPLTMPPHSLRSLGGGIFPLDEYSWQVCDTQDYSLSADGSGFTIELVAKRNVTFTGYSGVNISGCQRRLWSGVARETAGMFEPGTGGSCCRLT
jgi:hypothetical protein